jgi:hypothetical protein
MLLTKLFGPDQVHYDKDGILVTSMMNKKIYAIMANNWMAGGSAQFVDDYLSQPESRSFFRRGVQAMLSTLGWVRIKNESTQKTRDSDVRAFDALVAEWTAREVAKKNGPPVHKADITPAGARAPFTPKDPKSTHSQILEWKQECKDEVMNLISADTDPGRKELARTRLKSLLGVDELPPNEELANTYILGGW